MVIASLAAAALAALALGAAPPPDVVEGARRAPAVEPMDARAQVERGDAAFQGRGVKRDFKAARGWYAKAAAQGDAEAMRKLGEMHASGQGGAKSKKKALELWISAEKAGDLLAPALVADLYYEEITGESTPAPGEFRFLGEVPVSRVDDAIAWYEAVRDRDPRPEARERAEMALYVLNTIRKASVQVERK